MSAFGDFFAMHSAILRHTYLHLLHHHQLAPHASFSGGPHELHARSPASSPADVPPTTGEQPAVTHAMSPLSAVADRANPQPNLPLTDVLASDAPDIPPPVDERPVPFRPASAPAVVNVEAAKVTIPQPNSETETPAVPDLPDTTPIITNVVWTGLRATLQGLRDNSGLFPPLASAAGILLGCFDTIETSARTQKD
ncbi:hypothetical protein FRC11_011384 [Ceratobasidium sp. 423]|nr:hypothetical protein FRC11_011384 [Ceratobasidium sp. 423]